MLNPVHAPVAFGDRIESLRSHLVRQISPQLTLTTLGVRRFGQVEAMVVIHFPDGGRESLDALDARRLARLLRADWIGIDRLMVEWAESLDAAAAAAERQAAAIRAGQGSDAGVRQARIFGGR